ncbi:FAD-dependent oxidoreductase [Anoxynatronum buryatiense]|uniref:Urocanate reductase n=1 Tax=Anoxynatronum buryatiense TaxID=489973 RepID=A0AA45WVH0_9CLOT|nr:FAD-dependent oxidoreductase [Anoxynatronum buryatiense]SMP53724.1 fumarate reductase flavoprotein subunit [Anoxynatronum buryatiense]
MKRKLMMGLLIVCLMAGLLGCSSENAGSAEPETYVGTAKGYGGDVTVTVTMEENVIKEVTAEGPDETEGIGTKALEELPAAIVAANSTEVDVIAGATVTSNAILTAVRSALNGGDGVESADMTFTPGTYAGEAYGYMSTIVLDVTVSEDAITGIEVVESGDSPILFDAARDGMISEILTYQTLAVDVVSGATSSSHGILNATKDALLKAGASEEMVNRQAERPDFTPESIENTADVIVVGGGGAGLVAAATAAEEGATVILVEKAPYLGGNLVVFGGIYNTPDPSKQSLVEMSEAVKTMVEKAISAEPANESHAAAIAAVKADYDKWKAEGATGLFDSASWFALQTWNAGDQVASKELVDVMCDNAYEGFEWLEAIGVEFTDGITQGAGSLYQRTHGAVKPNGSGFIDAYVETLNQYSDQVEILMETAADSLIMDGSKVVGITATDVKGNTYTLNANKGVVLATGGFAGNVALRQEYAEGGTWKDLGENVLTTNLKAVSGDGILMARDIGVNLVDMEHIQLLHLGNPFSGATTGVIPYKGRNADEVIFVNAEGNRFVAEDARRDVICNAILEQPGGFYWMIHDSKNIDPNSDLVANYLKGGYFHKADTLEELAEIIEVPAETLVASVDQYNHSVETKVDEVAGRGLFVETIDEGPYFAAKRVASAHHTMGGVEIDADARVYYEDGTIVEGLFAAGEVTGAIHGGNRVGGNAVVDTVVFGRIAGFNAAK